MRVYYVCGMRANTCVCVYDVCKLQVPAWAIKFDDKNGRSKYDDALHSSWTKLFTTKHQKHRKTSSIYLA